ncbi:MAG: glycerol-3-phosphate ABC transporter ATP-binding protein [Betaproteobacteria bacterium HGW-Betaproteobacteria-13]|jgi:ABC-type sugar transport system ATPase subunit|nr:MAG: glycerol-3-phosphate ABC transporter ATP-binding protein [Betaproteobacteria bacterium HGW-Betaproteobacteria-13]
MASLSLQQVGKTYGTQTAVEALDLDIADREFTVLVGPSGCGKSTTLRMIAGLESITSGRLLIDGKDVTEVPPQQRDIAMVFQSYALYPHMTAYMNMAFGLMKTTRLDKREIEARVHEAASILHIEDLLLRKPNELSGGQRQRVAIGRALVRKPKVFLFDEPLSNLDAKLRNHMRAELKRLHSELGITVVYVTHDQVEAMTLGTRIAVMAAGRLQQFDTPMTVYRKPANTFVAAFIGAPEMNLLRCRHSQTAEGRVVDGMSFRITLDGQTPAPAGDDILLGIRPEELFLAPADTLPGGQFMAHGTVGRVELLGADALAEVDLGHHRLVARVSAEQLPQPGQQVVLGIDTRRARLFDPVSGSAQA